MSNLDRRDFLAKINVFNKNSITPTLLIVYAVMIAIFASINPLYISVENIKSMVSNLTVEGIMAIGLTTVILAGNFDISVGSIFGVAAVVCAKLYNIKDVYIPLPVVIISAILVGLIIGAINGFFVTVIGLNSIITTLGTFAIFRGLSYLFASESAKIYYKPFMFLGRGFIFKHIPITFIYFIVLLLTIYIVLRFTKFGRNIYLVGASNYASTIAGINIKKTQFFTFILSGVTAAIGGMLITSQLGFARGAFGVGYEFKILTICILGGISLAGGRGTLVGVFVATLILGSISNGLAMIDVPITWRDAFQGIILIAAILIDSIRIKKRELLKS